MQWLPTALSTVVLLFVCAIWFTARLALRDAQRSGHRNRNLAGRLDGVETEIAALRSGLARVRGKVYAEPKPVLMQESMTFASDVCENWHIAQVDGPGSDAARCECDYCLGRRAIRESERARLVPKSNAGRVALAKGGGE
jgi:hypothetical protein